MGLTFAAFSFVRESAVRDHFPPPRPFFASFISCGELPLWFGLVPYNGPAAGAGRQVTSFPGSGFGWISRVSLRSGGSTETPTAAPVPSSQSWPTLVQRRTWTGLSDRLSGWKPRADRRSKARSLPRWRVGSASPSVGGQLSEAQHDDCGHVDPDQ